MGLGVPPEQISTIASIRRPALRARVASACDSAGAAALHSFSRD
jgi:hypothetical protein